MTRSFISALLLTEVGALSCKEGGGVRLIPLSCQSVNRHFLLHSRCILCAYNGYTHDGTQVAVTVHLQPLGANNPLTPQLVQPWPPAQPLWFSGYLPNSTSRLSPACSSSLLCVSLITLVSFLCCSGVIHSVPPLRIVSYHRVCPTCELLWSGPKWEI